MLGNAGVALVVGGECLGGVAPMHPDEVADQEGPGGHVVLSGAQVEGPVGQELGDPLAGVGLDLHQAHRSGGGRQVLPPARLHPRHRLHQSRLHPGLLGDVAEQRVDPDQAAGNLDLSAGW